MKRRLALQGLTAALPWLMAARRSAASERVQRLLCAVPAGSPPDRVARQYASRLALPWAGRVVVENRPGGGGIVAVAALRLAAGEASTMLLGHSGLVTMLPFAHPRLPYDPVTDLVAVSTAAETGFGFAIGPAVPTEIASLAAFIDWARARPREANVAYAGVATPLHALAVMVASELRVPMQPIGYSGGPQAVTDMLGGRIASAVLPEGLLRTLKEAGRLRVLATAGRVRSNVLPDVPSFAEQGLERLVVRDWFGFFMPAGVPNERVDEASWAVRKAVAEPALAAALQADGWSPLGSSPQAMRARIDAERPWWREVIAATGIRAE